MSIAREEQRRLIARDKAHFEKLVPDDIKRLIGIGIKANWPALVLLAEHDRKGD